MSENWRENFYAAQERSRRESELEREQSLARQRASREEGIERKRLRDLERGALGRAKSTSERRRIRDEIAELQAANKRRAEEERGRTEEGAIYDIKTHEEPTDNKGSSDTTIDSSSGIDEISGEQASGDSTGSNPGGTGGGGGIPDGFSEETLTICVNGSPEDRIFITK
jgi:hypothetical protein